ncbi:MAG: DUF3373 family protein [Arcobacteraceae bacterium]|nr:DUF3373 family protein [Arcobacteraceae bacterium]
MKRIITLSAFAALTTSSLLAADVDAKLSEMEAKITKLEESLNQAKKTLTEVKIHDGNDNVKWDVDYRTAIDKIDYTRADGTTSSNKDLMTSRLLLGMGFAPSENLVFKGKLSYNKVFGANPPSSGTTTDYPQRGMGFDTFDWVANETVADDKLRVKEAYWLYVNNTFLGADIPWSASIGRRPSTNGFLSNLREDDAPQSPLGHIINMEFDGGSFKYNLDKVTGVKGMYWKLCVGRGLTNAVSRFDMSGGLETKGDYSSSSTTMKDIDMKGFVFVPYNDGHIEVETTYFKGTNVPGFNMVDLAGATGMTSTNTGMLKFIDTDTTSGVDSWAFNDTGKLTMKSLGDMTGAAASFKMDGIGDGISDFLDNTTFFGSWAMSKTDPRNSEQVLDLQAVYKMVAGMALTSDITSPAFKTAFATALAGMTPSTTPMKGAGMLGSDKSETGSSVYLGVQMPCLLTEDGRIGIEWNKGSKYWRSFTYGEDTLAGSKLATRGTALEIYYTKPLMKALSFQIRHTRMKYDYTGSQGFFGDDGMPMTMAEAQGFGLNPIEKATDTRAYVRYRF